MKYGIALLVWTFFCLPGLPAQNFNTVLRAKMTFSGQTLANVWGYAAAGREYALVGGSKGLIIVDITNPDAPQQIVQIPGPNNLWKEVKTYGHYAYVTSEGGGGVQIVDLANLPSANLPYHNFTGAGMLPNPLTSLHALHIDVAKGFLYAYGGAQFQGGAKILNLNPDPYNPTFAGVFDQLGYIHDGYVDNDTMYAGHIYAGQFSIVDMTNKSQPQLLATQNTPGAFTHNTWLSGDRRTIFATDEVNNSFLTAYDISDPADIRLLDKIQSNPGSNSMVHNTYWLDGYAVTSWYKDGFTIVDAARPDNLVQVGHYDTYPGSGGGSEGCWGVYPYFPSGTIIASNISAPGGGMGELFIITPNYARACYIEGTITHGLTGNALSGAKVEVVGSAPLTQELSAANGQFKMGQAQGGYFTLRVSKAGFQTYETLAYLQPGEVVILNVALFPTGLSAVTGQVVRASDLNPVAAAAVYFYGQAGTYTTVTDAAGNFSLSNLPPGLYDLAATAAGVGQAVEFQQVIGGNENFLLKLHKRLRRPDDRAPSLPSDPGTASILKYNAGLSAGDGSRLTYQLAQPGAVLRLCGTLGREEKTFYLNDSTGDILIPEELPAGIYLAYLEQAGRIVAFQKFFQP
jgi:choice-of-anchor B domain-containing protein